MRTITCYKCHVQFGVTDKHYSDLKDTGKTFYCPNGHDQYFTENNDSLIEGLKKTIEQNDKRIDDLKQQIDYCYRCLAATKGVVTKLRKKYEYEL